MESDNSVPKIYNFHDVCEVKIDPKIVQMRQKFVFHFVSWDKTNNEKQIKSFQKGIKNPNKKHNPNHSKT